MATSHICNEPDLERELLRLYEEGKRIGYKAGRFYQMFMPHCPQYVGGIETVRRIVSKGRSAGFNFAVEHHRLDLLVEHLVLDPKWQHLFAADIQSKARENLATISN